MDSLINEITQIDNLHILKQNLIIKKISISKTINYNNIIIQVIISAILFYLYLLNINLI